MYTLATLDATPFIRVSREVRVRPPDLQEGVLVIAILAQPLRLLPVTVTVTVTVTEHGTRNTVWATRQARIVLCPPWTLDRRPWTVTVTVTVTAAPQAERPVSVFYHAEHGSSGNRERNTHPETLPDCRCVSTPASRRSRHNPLFPASGATI